MKKIIFTAIILIFALLCELQAKIYTWTDENGVTHISRQAPREKEIQSPSPEKNTEKDSTKETPNNTTENRLQIPGTIVSIVPPSGFSKADRFPGFFRREADSSIMVTDVPGPYSEITKSFNEIDLSARSMRLLERKDVTVCGKNGLLLNIAQTAHKKLYEKWIVIFGSENETYLVTATFPQDLRDQMSNALRSSILSTQCSSDTDKNFFEGLTFTISNSPKMKFANRMGNNITMTKDGSFPVKNETDPILIAGASISQDLVIDNKKSFAIKLVQKIATLKNIEIEEIKNIKIDNLPGYEITARGTDKYHGETNYAYQVILFGDTDYYLIVGIVTADEKADYLPTFRQVAKSFKQNKNAASAVNSAVQESFAKLKGALRDGDGNVAASLVTPATFDLYERCRRLSLDSADTDLETLPQLEVFLIFQLRWLLDRETLKSMNGAEVFSWGVQNGLVRKQTLELIELDNVQVHGNKATSTLFNRGQPVTDLVFDFELHNGIWKLNFEKMLRTLEIGFAELRKNAGKTKMEIAVYLIEKTYKKKVPPQILNGPLK